MAEHYFTAAPSSEGRRRTLEVELAGRRMTFHTSAGVFSPDRVDEGTAVLLHCAPDPPTAGALLDLGCGWGPLALTLGLLAPAADVWAVDVNERALALCAENARAAGLPGVHPVAPDQVPARLGFAAIWSNPPIRVGKAVLHELLATWLPRLEANGAAYLVVAKNLGADSLQRWLGSELGPGLGVSRYDSQRGYRVLEVVRRP